MSTHEDRVRRLLDDHHARRLAAALSAGETAETLAELQHQLTTTEQAYSKAYRTAVDSGWSEKDLRSIGLPNPPARPRKGTAAPAEDRNGAGGNRVAGPSEPGADSTS